MKVQTFPVGELKSNCHIVINEEVNQAVFIDCGGEPLKLLNYLTKNNLELKAILLTHGHYDHFEGVSYVQEKTNCKVYISKQDSNMLTSNVDSLAKLLEYESFSPVKDFITVSNGDVIKEGNLEFKVLSTAGHTLGSVCYICNDCLFTGDTLFKRSMGRTDFPTGSYFDMKNSLQKLYNLEGNYKVYTGHDGNTDLQSERDYNPRMKDAVNDDLYLY
jgi:glyoxylase-like metal-dependent hydrolase (beta-lactamase superfamily II)